MRANAASAPAATSASSPQSAREGGAAARDFFFKEYRLNHLLMVYGKPVIAIMDGVTMGGGVGISLPARYRIATERTRFAMPETGIGLFPDVGGGWHLSRLPDQTGLWLALTGARLEAADCLTLGLATHVVDSARLPALKDLIVTGPESIEPGLDRVRRRSWTAARRRPAASDRQVVRRSHPRSDLRRPGSRRFGLRARTAGDTADEVATDDEGRRCARSARAHRWPASPTKWSARCGSARAW